MTPPGLDLDAQRREHAYPNGIPITFHGTTYHLPAELPADVFAPLLNDELDLPGILRDAWTHDDVTTGIIESFLGPGAPTKMQDAATAMLELLFGKDDFAQFVAGRPYITEYIALITYLTKQYGSGLGEALGSFGLSTITRPKSNTTSAATTESTPEPSGVDPANEPGSSDSDDSAAT